MQTVAGTFATRADAERAAAQLEALGVPRDRITVAPPGTVQSHSHEWAVPTICSASKPAIVLSKS